MRETIHAESATMTNDHREQVREIIGNVNNYSEEHTGELSISAFGPLAQRIAAALSARDAEIERLRRWQGGLAATTVAWSEQHLSRDAEIKEVLEGLATHQIGSRRPCWCPPDYESEPHSPACLAARALYGKVSK